jgi:hypothetical protein
MNTDAIRAEDRQGNIWIARSEIKAQDHGGTLCRVSATAVQCFGQGDGILLQTAMGLTIDATGNIWIFGNQGPCKWNDGVVTPYFQKELTGRGYLIGVSALAVQNEEHFWVSLQQANGNLELREFDHGRWRVHRLPGKQGSDASTNVLFLDAQGVLWIGTASNGVYRISANKVDHFSMPTACPATRWKCDLAISLNVQGSPSSIHPVVRQEIFMIVYEAIRNACRLSGGQTINVQLSYEGSLSVRIRDDGHGIDEQTLKAGKAGHFGPTGMRERARRINAPLKIWSDPGKDTEVVLLVPGKMIFEPSPRSADSFFQRLTKRIRRAHTQRVQSEDEGSE